MQRLFAAVVLAALSSAAAFAQSAMPGQTTVGSTMMHQAKVPHTAVLSHMPHQDVIQPTAMPGDRAGYKPFYRDQNPPPPSPLPHEPQQQL
jgi:hypothetical protein